MKVLAISNKIRVVNTNSKHTKLITFWDDFNVFGIGYENNVGFQQQFRLGIVLGKPKALEQGKVYRNNRGVYQYNNVIIDRQLSLDTDYFDDRTHLAFTIATKHKYFYIDGKRYFRNSDYDIEHNEDSGDILKLAPAKTTVIEQGKGFTNQAC